MKEGTARKVLSGWSAFRLGMTRPELTVLSVGEFDLVSGKSEWGIVIRDLRTGREHLIIDDREWERIKKTGLPPVGSLIGVDPTIQIASSDVAEDDVQEDDQDGDDRHDKLAALLANRDGAASSIAPVLASDTDFQLAIAAQAMAFVRELRSHIDLSLEAGYAAASEVSVLYLIATMQQAKELDPTGYRLGVSGTSFGSLESYVEEATGGVTGALMASFSSEWNHEDEDEDEDEGDPTEEGQSGAGVRDEVEEAMDIDNMDARIAELDARFSKRLNDYADHRVGMPIDPHSSLARQFALRIRTEVGGTSTAEDAALAAVGALADINPRGHLKALFGR